MQFRWMRGMVCLGVTGLGLDSFLREARRRGIILYDLQRPGRTQLSAVVNLRQARAVMALAAELGLQAEVRGSRGLPTLWHRIRARPALFLSLLLGFALLLSASGRIWEVQVVGVQGTEAREIIRFLAGEGLYVGASAGDQNINVLEYKTRQTFGNLRFVGIRLAGVRATVTVAHGLERPGEADLPGSSVVAARAGVVERVTARQGTPRVTPGQVVASGELLIEGVMEYPEGDEREPRVVAAEGEVMARVWVSARASGTLTRVEADPQGNAAQEWTLILGNRRWPLSLGEKKTDMLLENVKAWRLPGFAAAIPIALERRQYRQGVLVQCDYDTLLDSLRSQSGAEALRLLPEDAEVLTRTESVAVEEGVATLTTRLQARCDIAQGQ